MPRPKQAGVANGAVGSVICKKVNGKGKVSVFVEVKHMSNLTIEIGRGAPGPHSAVVHTFKYWKTPTELWEGELADGETLWARTTGASKHPHVVQIYGDVDVPPPARAAPLPPPNAGQPNASGPGA